MPGYGDFAYYYDLLTGNVNYEELCGCIHHLLCDNGVDEGILLDMACGTGTLSFLFEKKGYDVIGVDASEDILSVAQEKKIENGSDIVFLCQKMQELDLFGTVDAAVCTLDSLNHVTNEEDVRKIFEKVSLFMNDKGLFIFDVNTPYKHKNVLADNTFVYDLDTVYCVWQNTYNEKDGSTDICLDFFEQDAENPDAYYRSYEEFTEKGYEIGMLRKWVEEFGFEVLDVLDADTKQPLSEKSERALFVCRKHGTQLEYQKENNTNG